jgi:hypothetical protein
LSYYTRYSFASSFIEHSDLSFNSYAEITMGGGLGIYFFINNPALLSELESYATILLMYGLISSLSSNSLASGRVSGFLSKSYAIIV